MDTAIIISIVSLIVSVIGTAIAILYTRKRTRIMEQQLGFAKEEADRKKAHLEAGKTIEGAMKGIKEYASPQAGCFHFHPLGFSRDNILSYIHDKQLKELKIRIKPTKYKILLPNKKGMTIRTEKELKEILSREEGMIYPSFLYFDCEPDILENNFVEFADACYAIEKFSDVFEMLKPFYFQIKACDSSLLDDMDLLIRIILQAIHSSVMVEHEISFTSNHSSAYIYRELMNKIVGFQEILKALATLSGEICNRLSEAQRQILQKY